MTRPAGKRRPVRVRFAPNAHAPLFVASARVALANDLFARQNAGVMTLRIDDLDRDRADLVEPLLQDLHWFGIEWQEVIRQSERQELYRPMIERLTALGLLYPCYESEEELRAKENFRRKRRQKTIYDRAMLSLTPRQREAAEASGKRPYWRLKLSGRVLEWRDMVLGERRADLSAVSDPVLVQADETPSPILASVIDDILTGTTHILRADDNVANTGIQIELFEILTGAAPRVRFAHLPALGEASRRSTGLAVGSQSLRSLRNDGIEPAALIACITGLGPDAGTLGSEELARQFDLDALAQAGFDAEQMLAANRRVLRQLDFTAVAARLPQGATEAFWLAVRGSLDLLREARGWWDVVAGTIVPPVVEGERDLLLTAEALLPPEPWDGSVWSGWIAALERTTQLVGEALLLPLRLALTGEETGPDLADLLPLIGRARAASRLQIAAA